MPTQNELNISNKSYTNKDFNTIYSELLDLVLTLTNKWDPTHSNESDPGVVLIKLAALMADKNNYNIDKNILECFPLSASQEGNVRAFYDLLGYSMGWYNSATCNVNVQLTDIDSNVGKFALSPFTYIISDESGKINYTIIGQTNIGDTITLNKGVVQQALAMEGAIQDFTVGGSSIVKLENLDSNLRLYFNEKNVAENGIFISNLNGSGNFNPNDVQNWVKVDNLASTESTQKCYKFGVLPNSNTCYIQFSPNINRDIADGIAIKYLVSNGETGRISANTLTGFTGDVTSGETKLTLKVSNPSSSIGGYNPQDLEDAYSDYKRVINTFSTLVTEKDYENFIYELRDAITNKPLVSNVVVSDRTDDINNTEFVVKLQSDLTSNKELIDNPKVTAYNIAIYALKPPANLNTAKDYNITFTPVDAGQERDIEASIEDVKSIQHDYIDTHPANDPIPYIYKNQYTLQGTVYTYNKVTESEAKAIEDNIQKALFNNFNAREVDFGYDVEYNHLVDVITKADSRIRLVALNQPEYNLTLMKSDGEIDSNDNQSLNDDAKKGLLTKMISKGNVELFDYNKRFNWDFGQLSSNTYENISTITTETKITATANNSVDINANENVQFFRDNFIVKTSYSAYVTYSYTNTGDEKKTLSSGVIYKLKEEDGLSISYTNESGAKINTILTGFIRPVNIDIEVDAVDPGKESKTVTGYLRGNQAIEVLEVNSYIIKEDTKCFWVTSDFEIDGDKIKYPLFKGSTTTPEPDKDERILDNNEYFIYLDESQNVLNILQSGTKLTRDHSTQDLVYSTSLNINIANIMEQGTGVAETEDVEWLELPYAITSTEQSIISLGEGSKFTLGNPVSGDKIDNSLKLLEYNFSYIDENKKKVTVDNSLRDYKWRVRSRLNINASENNPQQLLEDEKRTQSISITYTSKDDTTGKDTVKNTTIANTSFYTNPSLNISGGENINVQELTTAGTYESTLSIYSFTEDENYNLKRSSNGWLNIDNSEKFGILSGDGISFSTEPEYYYIIPLVFVNNKDTGFKIALSTSDTKKVGEKSEDVVLTSGAFWSMNIPEKFDSSVQMSGTNFNPGVIYVYVTPDVKCKVALKISVPGEKVFAGSIYIGNIFKLPLYTNTDTDELFKSGPQLSSQVFNTLKINKLDAYYKDTFPLLTNLNEEGYDWTYVPLPEDLIDTDNVDDSQKGNLFNPKVIWDANHICNKFTIAQYDASHSSIKISSTSKQR